MAGLPLSSMVGSPISGWITAVFNGAHGLSGWQWLFLLEALPPITFGIAILAWPPNSIETAGCSLPRERKRCARISTRNRRRTRAFCCAARSPISRSGRWA
ncbi:hypothetical protein [Burkholderia gladioli]|uniref:hypothetical protein n=1 Tax=Burkholderia gladioli TaxID=28095 RepID=UPI002E790AA9|nr:hypothetical protein [Burkholderia gladioli]